MAEDKARHTAHISEAERFAADVYLAGARMAVDNRNAWSAIEAIDNARRMLGMQAL